MFIRELAQLRRDFRRKETIIKTLQADARRKENIIKKRNEEVGIDIKYHYLLHIIIITVMKWPIITLLM